MNEIEIFKSAEFGEVRTLTENEKTLFCGADIAKALGYVRPSEAVARHCKVTSKQRILTNGGSQDMLFISEGDVYRLIVSSKLSAAEKFEKWVFDEILPTIRKHGAYMTDSALEQALTSPDFLIKLATQLKAEKERNAQLETKIESDKPLVAFANAVSVSNSAILIGDLAKLIKQNGYDIDQKRLFQWMRDNGYLIKRKGADYNSPTQRAMDMGLFEIKETVISNPDGSVRITKTPKVVGKGQVYFVNLFLKQLV